MTFLGCLTLIPGAHRLDEEQYFRTPPADEEAPHYSLVVKKPMAFSIMKKRLEAGEYTSLSAFQVRILCSRAMSPLPALILPPPVRRPSSQGITIATAEPNRVPLAAMTSLAEHVGARIHCAA